MKVDRTKSKRSCTEVPPECKVVIDKIKACKTADELFTVISGNQSWTFGKCELYHWIDVLDIFDAYLEEAAQTVEGSNWAIVLDVPTNETLRCCVAYILYFTTLLIEHSFSRHLYNSMDHLVKLLNSVHIRMVLDVLQLLYMFSKRSNFLTRLPEEKREGVLERLTYIADSWGGKEAGFGLAACCKDLPLSAYPLSARSVHMEFSNPSIVGDGRGKHDVMTVVHFDDVTKLGSNPAVAMDKIVGDYSIPGEKQIVLFTHLRLAFNFPDFASRCQCVQARLQALAILVYTNALHDNFQLLYSGLMEEIVDLLELDDRRLSEIKAAGLRVLTAVIHLDRAHNFPSIIDVTGIGSYHGFLPIMVRNCITSMIAPSGSTPKTNPYPVSLATSLFSFIYHLASYELGGDALVNCGVLECLLKVVSWQPKEQDHITFVTRAVRVIDLITNMDMQGFHTHSGLTIFINRLETEVTHCRKEQPFEIVPHITYQTSRGNGTTVESVYDEDEDDDVGDDDEDEEDTTRVYNNSAVTTSGTSSNTTTYPSQAQILMECIGQMEEENVSFPGITGFVPSTQVCFLQRAALLKSLLNFLKKVIQDASFSDTIRHIMETSLPNSLRHIISNAEYYGSSLFLLATDVVTAYVFQEPSLLSALQDSGLTGVVQEAILIKDVPATREVIASIPNIFSALCLNTQGLHAFLKCKPFHKICKILISPQYLAAMRRRRSAEPMGETATNLGNAMDELMRHQPGLRYEATTAMVKLLVDLCKMSIDVRDSCWKEQPQRPDPNPTTARTGNSEVGSSEEEDDDEEPSISSQAQGNRIASANGRQEPASETGNSHGFLPEGKPPPPLVDYIFNVMKFLDAILSNNSTDDHCRAFVSQVGLKPLLSIFSLPNLPLDFPNSASCQAVSAVCKSILSLAREPKVLQIGLSELNDALIWVEKLGTPISYPGSSVLLHEIAIAKTEQDEIGLCGETSGEASILSCLTAVHSLVMMFIQVCRTGQPEVRSLAIEEWGNLAGVDVLKKLSKLYLNLVWESTVLLAICTGEYSPEPGEFAYDDLKILVPQHKEYETNVTLITHCADQMDVDEYGNPNSSRVSSYTQTVHVARPEKANVPLQEYAKLLKPVLSASSRLGRALAELFGLLVKLTIGSPLRQRRGVPLPSIPQVTTPWADTMAGVLSELVVQALRWKAPQMSPVPNLQLSICAVGFSSPLIFDEKRFPYHLMLKKFVDVDGCGALFELFYWAMDNESNGKDEKQSRDGVKTLSEQQVEFLDSWLVLIERFVNPKTVMESPHPIPPKNGFLTNRLLFNATGFLGHMHKLAFKAILHLWKTKPIKALGGRSADLMLTILCSILRFKDQQDKKSAEEDSSSTLQVVDTFSLTPAMTPREILNLISGEGDNVQQLSHELVNSTIREIEEIQLETARRAIARRSLGTETSESTSQNGESCNRAGEPIASTSALNQDVVSMDADGASIPHQSSHDVEQILNTSTDDSDTDTIPPLLEFDEPGSSRADVSNGNTLSTAPPSTLSDENAETASTYGLDLGQLQQLMDMGFSRGRCVEALISSNDLMHATDYLLLQSLGAVPHPGNLIPAMPPLIPTPSFLLPHPPATRTPGTQYVYPSALPDNEVFRAILMSMDEHDRLHKPDDKHIYEVLSSEEINEFTVNVFDKCLELVEQVPESVYRVCELLVAVGSRKGSEWTMHTIRQLMKQTISLIREVKYRLDLSDENIPVMNPNDLTLSIRLHLISLLFEELKSNCFEVIEYSSVIMLSIELLETYRTAIGYAKEKGSHIGTPKWMAPTILLLDLYEKAAAVSRRKGILSTETDHTWKWYDINSGKWCTYSTPNNQAIDKAFWEGEPSVKITAGRRRYVISFGGMVQLNEETTNRRPIALWLKQKRHPSMLRILNGLQGIENVNENTDCDKNGIPLQPKMYVVTYPSATPSSSPVTTKSQTQVNHGHEDEYMVRKEMLILNGLVDDEIKSIISACVDFMSLPVEAETLHAILRLCLRLTRDYHYASFFSEQGGVTSLLNLTTSHHFNGFLPLANLIIRHCMEDPVCLRFAIEKMMREKICTPCAATCKELHYLLRVLTPLACRAPDVFVDVAKEILRVDIPFVTRRGLLVEEDRRLVVKPLPSKPETLRLHQHYAECTRDVMQKLLLALAERYDDDEEDNMRKQTYPTAKCSRPIVLGPGGDAHPNQRAELIDPFEQMDLDAASASSTPKSAKNDQNEKSKSNKPLISKCAILQILAEAVHSYSYGAKIIAEFTFEAGCCKSITEDCTALAFLLDRLGPMNQFLGNKDYNTLLRDLIATMGCCNHIPDAQCIVICEIKAALQRFLTRRDSQEKHHKIQHLLNLISFMMETCQPAPMTQYAPMKLPHTTPYNHVVRLLVKKNVVTDLARVVHQLDLSSKCLAQTINAALKCLEIITRAVNFPQPIPTKSRPKLETHHHDSDNNTQTVGTSNSEGTRAQGEDVVEDPENTEHDISGAAESLDPISEGHTQDHDQVVQDEVFEEIIDRLLERGHPGVDEVSNDNQNSLMDTETNEDQQQDVIYDRDHRENDSDSSISEGSSEDDDVEDDDDDQNDGADDDEDDDDDDEEEDEDEVDDEEDQMSTFGGTQEDERFLRAPALERENMFMVEYDAGDGNGPIFFTNNATYNYNLGVFEDALTNEHSTVGLRLSHPLLQPPSADSTVHSVTRGHRTGRQRRYQHLQYINPRHPPPPAILQRLLGPSTAQEVIQLTTGQPLNHQAFRDGRVLVMETATEQSAARPIGNTNAGVLSNFTALHWWCEEAKVLDGESMHDCVVAVKRSIVETVESIRDAVFQARRDKRTQDENRKKSQDTTLASSEPADTSNLPVERPDLSEFEVPAGNGTRTPSPEMTMQLVMDALSRQPTSTETTALELPIGRIESRSTANTTLVSISPGTTYEPRIGTPDVIARLPWTGEMHTESDEPRSSTTDTLQISDTEVLSGDGEAAPQVPIENCASASNEPESEEPVAGPSGLQHQNFREILGDIEIPDGVDPSFLAALPEDMRQEVISEHLRIERLRQQTAQPPREGVPTDSTIDVSPEFLAALPPSIQEEVLAHQRLEQQRIVATTSNPNDPVDTDAFFRTLQPSLRQVILADMEESQMATLPPEYAEEAQNLRRNWVTRNRQLLQDRLFQNHHTASSALSSILRHGGMRLSGRYGLAGGMHRSHWPTGWIPRQPITTQQSNLATAAKATKGKQLIDFETLSCLMVILFLDDPKINTGRLHRVIRNVCYHPPTRAWMIKSLLSVLEKSNESNLSLGEDKHSPLSRHIRSLFASDSEKRTAVSYVEMVPSWLNISLESALGCSSNVFQIYKAAGGSAKKMGPDYGFVSINPQAVTQIARHTIDALSNLAKTFPVQFLTHIVAESEVKILNTDMTLTTDKRGASSSSSTPAKSKLCDADLLFWDFLLKLDGSVVGRKGKSWAKLGGHAGQGFDSSQGLVPFEAAPFGKLIKMLGFEFIRRSQLMTDKLLRLISVISVGIPENSGYGKKVILEEPQYPVDNSYLISESHLQLIIDILTSKNCSEDGLEETTALLLNLSYGPPTTRNRLLALLTEGVRKLGKIVCSHIIELISDLKKFKLDSEKEEEAHTSTSSTETENVDKVFKGMMTDRFTKETVVITASAKYKSTYELQLPAMAALTSKTSSQAFFLRLLKVIMHLRDIIRTAVKRHKQKDAPSTSASSAADVVRPSPNESPTQRRREAFLNRFLGRQLGFPVGGRSSRGSNALNPEELFLEVMLPDLSNSNRLNPLNQNSDRLSETTPSLPTNLAVNQPMTGGQGKFSEMNIRNDFVIDESKLLPRLSIELRLDELWSTLSTCLLALGHTPDHHAVLILQPAVEAFFLVHTWTNDTEEKKNTPETREAQLAHLEEELPPVLKAQAADGQQDTEMIDPQNAGNTESSVATSNLPPDTKKFIGFAETHRTVLNQILRQSSGHLVDGPFAVLVDHTRVLDFDIKRKYFRSELNRLDAGTRREDLAVHVRRPHIFEDSFRELHRKTAEEWKNRFYIVFEGEEGQDAGGLLREWYVIISREIFNPMYALFTISPGDRVTYMINSSSHCNSNHLFYFKFVGRVIAKAIYDNKLLECYFTRSFYKHILGKSVKHGDMESEDYAFFQGLAFLMDNHISELGYDVTFSTEVQEFGVTEIRDLIQNGRNIPVTEENKMEYVRLVCQMKMTGAIRKQLNAFLEGFYDIIPKRLISIFNEQELELLVSGLPNIDIEDLKSNTEYHKYQSISLQIQWFWRALRSFDQADRAKFLQFVTGTSKVPLQGFGSLEGMNGIQKFQIHRDDRSTDRLPSAHTCFNQLDLPVYETYDKLRTYMLKAIHECSEGFGFA